jgi:hypothetical protein
MMTWMKPVLAGVASVAVAGAATWVYLRSITIDDGLEGLIYLPILSVAMIAITARAGWRGHEWAWARSAALGAAGATSLFLLALAVHRSDATLARAAIGASLVVAVFPFTGAVIGWGLATWLRRHR